MIARLSAKLAQVAVGKKNGTHSCGDGRREFQVAAGQGKRGAPPGRICAIPAAPGGDHQPPPCRKTSNGAARRAEPEGVDESMKEEGEIDE